MFVKHVWTTAYHILRNTTAANKSKLSHVENRHPDFDHKFKEQATQNCSVQKQRGKTADVLTSLHCHFLSFSVHCVC